MWFWRFLDEIIEIGVSFHTGSKEVFGERTNVLFVNIQDGDMSSKRTEFFQRLRSKIVFVGSLAEWEREISQFLYFNVSRKEKGEGGGILDS